MEIYIYSSSLNKIKKVDTAGIITTICGDGSRGNLGDGGPATAAEIYGYCDMAMDSVGNLFFTDAGNNCVRKIDTAGTIYTVAGQNGFSGFSGDGGLASAALLDGPLGITINRYGELYIIDQSNYRIRKVDTNGIINTIAGTGVSGFSPDGSNADTCKLSAGANIKVDSFGNLYFYDNGRIRRIDTSGILSTIAGNGTDGFSGDNGPATAAEINGGFVDFDTASNIYFTDVNNNRVRKINKYDTITTIAGTGYCTPPNDGGSPLLADLCAPQAISIDKMGNIYVGDVSDGRVREITMDSSLQVKSVLAKSFELSVCPNPSFGDISIELSAGTSQQYVISISDVTGKVIRTYQATTNNKIAIATGLTSGFYLLSAYINTQTITQKLIIY